MSDNNGRSRSTLWRQARSEMSRVLNSAVLNVDRYTIDKMYGNDMECNLHYENTFESDFSCAAAAASSELYDVECEFGLASNTEAKEKSDNPNLRWMMTMLAGGGKMSSQIVTQILMIVSAVQLVPMKILFSNWQNGLSSVICSSLQSVYC